jgi:hypothetical protein
MTQPPPNARWQARSSASDTPGLPRDRPVPRQRVLVRHARHLDGPVSNARARQNDHEEGRPADGAGAGATVGAAGPGSSLAVWSGTHAGRGPLPWRLSWSTQTRGMGRFISSSRLRWDTCTWPPMCKPRIVPGRCAAPRAGEALPGRCAGVRRALVLVYRPGSQAHRAPGAAGRPPGMRGFILFLRRRRVHGNTGPRITSHRDPGCGVHALTRAARTTPP